MSIQGLAAQSLVTFRNSQGTEARGTLLKLTRSTIVFEVYNPYSVVQLSELLQHITLRHSDKVIYEGRGVVTNLMNTGLMLVVSVTTVDGWRDLTNHLNHPDDLRFAVSQFVATWNKTYQIRSGYQLAVSKLRGFFGDFRQWLEQVDVAPAHCTEYSSQEPTVSSHVFDAISEPSLPKLEELFSLFEEEATKIEEPELGVHKAYAQRDLHPFMLRSPFIHRAYTKPLGYAGDYEMVNMMLRENREGPTAFAQILNRYYLNIGPSIAHRNRIRILESTLERVAINALNKNRKARILNIGCGPAIEVQEFIRNRPIAERCDFTLVDFNKQTIDYAKEMIDAAIINSGTQPTISYTQQSVHSLIKEASTPRHNTSIDKYDLVYCAGLFDYLSDKVCSRLLTLFHKWTRPEGTILASNVHPCNPNRYQMEHIAEWYLIYRSNKEMEKISPRGVDRRIFRDKTGVNVFIELAKTASE